MTVLPAAGERFALSMPVLIVGAGACGLTAALEARRAGAEVMVLERDGAPSGSTALSAGLIPAAGTRFQAARGIADAPDRFAADIQAKAGGRADPQVVARLAQEAAPSLHWLADAHGLPFELVEGFDYPGHSRPRMHGLPERTGDALIGRLLTAASDQGVDVVTDAHVTTLFADAGGRVRGLRLRRPDGSEEQVGCGALVLACNGFGGSPDLVRRHIPEMADALYFGHAGNRGDALLWGRALGAAAEDLSAYQGHASVAHPHGVLVTWAVIMQGGVQVNGDGRRFADETSGYSEQAVAVLAQPGGIAWNVYGDRQHAVAAQFADYRDAVAAGAVRRADDLGALARATGLPEGALSATIAEIEAAARSGAPDRFGRCIPPDWRLEPPLCAVRVTGALFHTQGGLAVDPDARVLRPDGTPLPNLLAGGGAARGVSGPTADGYLSGNGLLTAVVLGRLAGATAARLAM